MRQYVCVQVDVVTGQTHLNLMLGATWYLRYGLTHC